ncbi:ATP-binding protein, partial [Candidatus Methanarcanum hacksteinii]
MGEEKDVECKVPLEEWVEGQTFQTTDDIQIPEIKADQVIGQEEAVDIVKKAASQKRHVMLIGEPGTGKSMLANAMTEYLPKGELQDVIAYHNPEDFNEPRIRVLPAGRGKTIVNEQKAQAAAQKNRKNNTTLYIIFAILGIAVLYFIMTKDMSLLWIGLMASFLIFMVFRTPGGQR